MKNEEGSHILINSEFGQLKRVIVHEPQNEIDRLTPSNKERLLFEDIPYLKRMQKEHRNFVNLLVKDGVEVLQLRQLVTEVLQDETIKNKFIAEVCNLELQPGLSQILLDHYSTSQLTDVLFKGITTREIAEDTGINTDIGFNKETIYLLDPIPNAYFTRDPGAIVGKSKVSGKMHYKARVRESLIIKEIFQSHPIFSKYDFSFGEESNEDKPFCIEGGDIIVLNNDAIAIGCSQRTRSESIETLATNLFRKDLIKRVYEINIPSLRSYMHLDTVFTVVNKGLIVSYPEVMDDIKEINLYEPAQIQGSVITAKKILQSLSFYKILEKEFGGLEVINTGNNNNVYARREQRADGTNVFAISPSKVITYERNYHTNKALRANGVEAITIEGSELVRGLGGPRCMTMPIYREEI